MPGATIELCINTGLMLVVGWVRRDSAVTQQTSRNNGLFLYAPWMHQDNQTYGVHELCKLRLLQ
jgi:hypothetical protein